MAKSGLPFYGFAPYQNNLPLGHADNAAAVSWLIGDLAGTGATAEGDGAAGAGSDGVDGEAQQTSRCARGSAVSLTDGGGQRALRTAHRRWFIDQPTTPSTCVVQ